MQKGFIEQNESGPIREMVLKGIAEVEKSHTLHDLSIEEIVDRIAESEIFEDSLVTINAVISIPYVYFKQLWKRASIEKLESLMNHPNFVVQFYAFVALAQKAPERVFKIIMSKLHITTRVKTLGFDMMHWFKVGDFFIFWGKSFLTDEQYSTMVDEIIEKNYNLNFKGEYLSSLLPEEKNYERVKRFATEFHNPDALVTLAKFQNESDVEVIQGFASEESRQFYEAVEIFPHPSLWKLLKNIHEKGLKREETTPPNIRLLYTALAVYKNLDTLNLLTNTFERIIRRDFVQYHAEAIFKAIRGYHDGFYDQLLFTLWKDYNQTNLQIFDYLWEKNPTVSYEAIRTSLNDPDKLYIILSNTYNFSDFMNDPVHLTEKMLRIYIKQEKTLAYRAIKTNLLEQNVNYLTIFTRYVSKLAENEFLETLFHRMSTDNNFYVYCAIARCILKYESPVINDRLLALIQERPYLTENAELKKILAEFDLL